VTYFLSQRAVVLNKIVNLDFDLQGNSFLKMLGLYLDTLIISHTLCSVSSILNELTLQRALQNFMINNVVGQKG